MKNNLSQFVPENYYHIFNRTNNKETLFLDDSNRFYFLDLVKAKLHGFASILAFSLLDNHFHYCIYIKSKEEISKKIKRIKNSDLTPSMHNFLNDENNEKFFHDLITKRLSGAFNSYAQSFNKENKRKGNLFYKPYKRPLLSGREHIKAIIYYIHHNARKHGIVDNFLDHEWHSYHLINSHDNPYIDLHSLSKIFNGISNLIEHHNQYLLEKDFKAIHN